LEGGPPEFRPGFTCPALLRCQLIKHDLSLTGLSPCVARLSRLILLDGLDFDVGPITPLSKDGGLGFVPFRSPLLRESLFDFFSSAY
jgi:hypothetical protein